MMGCGYCSKGERQYIEPYKKDDVLISVVKCNAAAFIEVTTHDEYITFDINYCPMCGRRLKDDAE